MRLVSWSPNSRRMRMASRETSSMERSRGSFCQGCAGIGEEAGGDVQAPSFTKAKAVGSQAV